jgi:hypothetical protein
MTDSSDQGSPSVSDVVSFRSDLFFEGAVQLRWVDEDPERALKAAQNFVFHGPRYHAVRREDASDGYVLKDTASFSAELVEALSLGDSRQGNPFSLAIAGYGSGKSHLAVTLAELLSAPASQLASEVLSNAKAADGAEGERLALALDSLHKPVLTVSLDGMANFNLGAELARNIVVKLRAAECDLSAIEELSPRFKSAEQFTVRNFTVREEDFSELLPGCDVDSVVTHLREHDEETYSAVDNIFERANGARIPVEGRESVQDLIATVTSVYCGEDGPFSGMLILFDEFGRFLEYAAEQPHLAGDSALQQLFQGVQDSAGRARFLGFIQYDLKAYVSRLDRRDLMHLQRYITRFDAAEKSYLSTNLETLFAHLIEKRDADFLERSVANDDLVGITHHLLMKALPEAERFPVWRDLEQFRRVISAGCWPLDPLAVWFLTRQQDVVQSRSALNIVKSSIERFAQQPALRQGGGAVRISAADLLLTDMLSEFVAAEQARGGTVAETLEAILEERAAQLEPDDRRVLAAAAILLKLRVRFAERDAYERFLSIAAGVGGDGLTSSLERLGDELGVLEWNDAFGQYELIQDAATRGQFKQLLKKRLTDPNAKAVGTLFATYGRPLCNLQPVDPGFADSQGITTQDWRFEPMFAASDSVSESIANAFRDWWHAADVNEAKGRIVYAYVGAKEDLNDVRASVGRSFESQLRHYKTDRAPVWVALLHDRDERLSESLQRWWVLERGLTDQERERYRRFVSAESDRVANLAQSEAVTALGDREHLVAGFDEAPGGRLTKVGEEIFARVYPQVVPFPFDGFSTGTGAGGTAKRDCIEIVRALVSGEADAEWIQSRPTRLRNRASHMLARAWNALEPEGALSSRPGNEFVASILETMDVWHQKDADRSLEETRRALIAPPFGSNLASSALLLGLFVARRWPRRRLFLDGEPVQATAWIEKAFKATDLDGKVLGRTAVGYVAEDAQARWEHLLEDWRNATRHRQRIEYRRQAQHLEAEGVVPEEYLYQYERLVDQAKESQQAILSFENKFEQVQKEIEGKLRSASSLSALSVADRLLTLHGEVTDGAWEDHEVDDVEALLSEVRQWIMQEAPRWIAREHCRSPQEVGEFRRKMEKAASTCEKLELAPLAKQIERQKNHSIATVDDRFKYHKAFIEAQQFANVTTISPMATVVELEALQAQVDSFTEVLREASEVLQDSDVDALIQNLGGLKREADDVIAQHRAELEHLYQSKVDSLDTALMLQARIGRAQALFSGKRDVADIEDARRQLEKVRADLETWNGIEGSPERIQAQLSEAIEKRVEELEHWADEEEVEPIWSFADIYHAFLQRKVDTARERSALWVRTFVPTADTIGSMSLEHCREKLQALERDQPEYLDATGLSELYKMQEALRARIYELEAEQRQNEAKKWLSQFEGITQRLDVLSRSECDQLLGVLRAPPTDLNNTDADFVRQLTLKVERRLDSIDVSDIVKRIKRLNPDALRQLRELVNELNEEA